MNFSKSQDNLFTEAEFNTDVGLIAPIRSSGRDSLDTAIFEFDQDGLITEAEFDAKMLASSLLFAVLDSMFAILTLQTMSLLAKCWRYAESVCKHKTVADLDFASGNMATGSSPKFEASLGRLVH